MTDPTTTITETKTWIQKHERLIIIVIAVSALIYIGRHWLDKHYDLASQEVVSTASTLLNQKDVNKQLQAQFDDLKQTTQQIITQVTAQNTQLAAQAQAAYQQAAKQQALDAQLSNQQLADRIAQLTNQKNVQSNDQGVQLNHDQSVGVTQQLEDVPSLQAQLKSEQLINTNNTKQIAGLTDEVNSCNQLNTGLKAENADQKKSYEAQLKKAKISGIFSRLKWFGAGFISGFIAGHIY